MATGNITIPEDVFVQVQALAAKQGKTADEVAANALKREVAQAERRELILCGSTTEELQRHQPEPTRKLSESLRLAREQGSTARLDGSFAHDVQAVIDSHQEPLQDFWK